MDQDLVVLCVNDDVDFMNRLELRGVAFFEILSDLQISTPAKLVYWETASNNQGGNFFVSVNVTAPENAGRVMEERKEQG